MAKRIGAIALTPAQISKRYNERHPEKRSEYYQNNKQAIKAKTRNRPHGITQEWIDARLIEQENKCAICFRSFTGTPHVDHNHECCKPRTSCEKCRRGLLCSDCNLGLGRFADDIVILERAIQYLKRHKGI